MDDLRGLLASPSQLGGPIEGVVIKNYRESILLGGHVWPLFCKLVNAQYREKHAANSDWQTGKSREAAYYDTFCTPARWSKAVQHLREKGTLQDAPQDIGPLMREIHADLLEEEEDNICDWLFRGHIKDLVQAAQRGFPEWYKDLLAKRVE